MRQLSGSDAFFLYSDKPGKHQHVSTIYIYDQSTAPDGTVRFKSILQHVRQRLCTSRLFRQKLVKVPFNFDYPYWIEDPHFELEFHVRHIALPQPGDWRQFCIQVARLHSRPLDMNRPVWEMYVIEGLDNIPFLPDGAFAVMTKVHHSAIDDVTENDLTVSLHDTSADAAEETRKDLWRAEATPGNFELLSLAWFNNTTKMLETGQALWDKLPWIGGHGHETEEALHIGDEEAPHTRFDDDLSPHRVWDARFFAFEDLQKIQALVPNATINDVILAICSGALRLYLDSKDELPDRSLWSLLPIHVHQESDRGIPGHRVKLIRAKLMTTIDDPLDRLQAIQQEMIRVKSTDTISASEMAELQDVLPSATMAAAARTIVASIGPGEQYRENHNTVITDIPGPQQPLYLCGAKLIAFTGMGIIMDNLALAHTVTRYDGQVSIAAVCDRAVMPDPALYSDCLEAAFAELLALTRKRAVKSTAAAAR
ncbi:MAG: wax ester/triacylglycerol synthase family O-acyltransferase [Gammaproteobacteria bacterium]|nr:wax ester/triacylglycerol synthase family O-acyltransferase [Gammaproteobacteria bacterium]